MKQPRKDAGYIHHERVKSPEALVLINEIIDMVDVLMGGIEINDETLALDLIERLGPRATFLGEAHTLKHFRKFWVPRLFDRSFSKEDGQDCEELLNKRTIQIFETHQPKPRPDDLVKELNKVEKSLLNRVGLKEYPKRKRE